MLINDYYCVDEATRVVVNIIVCDGDFVLDGHVLVAKTDTNDHLQIGDRIEADGTLVVTPKPETESVDDLLAQIHELRLKVEAMSGTSI